MMVFMGSGVARRVTHFSCVTVKTLILISGLLWSLVGCPQAASLLQYRFSEEEPPDTLVGNVLLDYGLSTTYSPLDMSQMKVQFRRTDGHYRYFRLNETTGLLRSSQKIDREAACPNSESCDIRLDIVVSPSNFFQIIKTVVVIEDVNDQTPTFDPDTVSVEMSESAAIGSLISLPAAVDRDSSIYAVQRYELSPRGTPFDLQIAHHRDGTTAIQLRVTDRLDRETLDSYYLVVTAVDGGSPPKRGQLRINVTVADSNDNVPRFDSQSYKINISETVNPGSVILTVRATDADVGWNALVFYSFAPYTESMYGEVFAIDNLTGEISTKAPLHYKENEDVLQLRVTAVDGGASPNSAFTRVTVRIADTNDNAPQMTVSTLTSSGQAEIVEHSHAGSLVAHVLVHDADRGDSGRATCDVGPATDFFLESQYANEYALRTARSFDRELEEDVKEALLTCVDHGIPPLSNTTKIPVRIVDVNDHSPRIQDNFKVSITENNAIGTLLMSLNATDEDTGPNGELRYELDYPGGTSDMAPMVVDAATGDVRANVVFNYEWRRIYTQRVLVCDRGETARCASTVLTVEVIDVNDEPPIFSRATYYFEVAENQPPGTMTGLVSAEDADANLVYRRIVYALRGCDGVFDIDSETGEIRTLKCLDREQQSVFRATVSASNEDFPSLKTAAQLVIHVTDENDNSPTVIYPTDPMIQVPCRALPGSAVARVQASDPDDGPAGTVTYFLTTNSNFTPLFEIDPQTGVITVAGSTPYSHECGVHWLTVRVTDNGVPKRSTLYDLFISLNASMLPAKAEVNQDQATSGMTSSSHDYAILFPTLVLGVVLLIVAIVGVFLLYHCFRRRQKKKQKKKDNEDDDQIPEQEMLDLNNVVVRKVHHVSRNLYVSGRSLDDYVSFQQSAIVYRKVSISKTEII